MTQYSISTRNLLYFKLLSIANALWNYNFSTEERINDQNSKRLKKLQKIIELLVLQELQP